MNVGEAEKLSEHILFDGLYSGNVTISGSSSTHKTQLAVAIRCWTLAVQMHTKGVTAAVPRPQTFRVLGHTTYDCGV